MNQKKWVCAGLCFCIFCFTALAELRDFVVIMTPVLHKTTAANYNKIADYFQDYGHVKTAEVFRSFDQGGKGSGFVITDRQGENYIITNRHIVARAESVNITINSYAGTDTTFKNCPVVYIDDELDLAVLRFPRGEKVYKRGLTINARMIKDGSEVWSAGYPDLFGRPDWQFSKGTVTNQGAAVPEMADSEVSYIIRHSANIGPGSSGGPLLIWDSTSFTGYSVIGINTWTVGSGQNFFFAIPAKNIPVVVQKAKRALRIKQDREACRQDLQKKCQLLAAQLKSRQPDYNKAGRFISYTFADRKGMESFMTVVKTGDSTQKEKWERSFFFYSPIEIMRSAIFALFWNSIGGAEEGTEIDFKEIEDADQDDFPEKSRISTVFRINGKEHEIVWVYESGHWYIADLDLSQVKQAYGVETPLLGSRPQGRIGIGIHGCLDIFSELIEDNLCEVGLLLEIPILPQVAISTGFNFLFRYAAYISILDVDLFQIPVFVKYEWYLDLSSNVLDFSLIPFVALGLGLDFPNGTERYDVSGPFFKAIGRAGVEIRSDHLSLGFYLSYNYYLAPSLLFEEIEAEKPKIGVLVKYNL
jgi:S1-C subfamily serine protease